MIADTTPEERSNDAMMTTDRPMHTDVRTLTLRGYRNGDTSQPVVTRARFTPEYADTTNANPWEVTLTVSGYTAPCGTYPTRNEAVAAAELWHERYINPREAALTPQLIGLEGWRVEVETTYGETRRFYVGRSTGWQPCHIEVSRRNSTGGCAADLEYKSIRKLYKR